MVHSTKQNYIFVVADAITGHQLKNDKKLCIRDFFGKGVEGVLGWVWPIFPI